VWGGNYFTELLKQDAKCWFICWDKNNGESDNLQTVKWLGLHLISQWLSMLIYGLVAIDTEQNIGVGKTIKIHPTQKPVYFT
jgi:hypothetical protein